MIDYVNEQLFRENSIHKAWSITGTGIDLGNTDLYGECIELSESLCSESNLIFGSVLADTIKFSTFSTETSFKGKEIFVSVVLNNDDEHPFSVGYYIVDEETLSADRTKKEITAYHKIYQAINKDVASWYNGLTFPMTLKQFRDSFFAYCSTKFGIQQSNVSLINDNMIVRKTINPKELPGLKVLNAICEANAVFGHMGRSLYFKYIQLLTTSVYTITRNMYKSYKHEDYTVQNISKLQIRQEEGDIGVVIGTGDNGYVIEDNFLFYGMSSEELTPVAENIYNIISVVSFTPCHVEGLYGNPCVEVGDRINVVKKDGTTFSTYLLTHTIKGLQALSDIIDVKGDETYPDGVNGVNYDIRQLEGKTNILAHSIEETRSTITNIAAGLQSEIRQTAEGLEIEIQNLQSQIDGEIEYFERSGTPTLTNYPAWDFTSAFKCDGTKKCAPLYKADMTLAEEGETGQYPHFYYSEQDYQDHLRDLVFDKQNAISYRFMYDKDEETGQKVWYWQEIADSETAYILQQLSELRVTAEALESDMTSVEATISSQGLQIQTNTSNITQTASAIETEVTRATTAEGNLSSRITQNATEISAKVSAERNNSSFGWHLKSDKFELKSNNQTVFKCDEDGIEVSGNATFSGTVRSSNIIGSTIEGAIITGGTLNGTFTMGQNASFSTFRFDGSFVQKTDKVAFYGASSNPSMKYDSSFGGYVPVFSSPAAFQRYMGMSQYSLGTKVLIC